MNESLSLSVQYFTVIRLTACAKVSSALSGLMEHKLVAVENELLEELVKEVQSKGLRGENGGWKEFLDVYDKKFGSSIMSNDPSTRSHDVLVAFLATFKKRDLKFLHCIANRLLIDKFKQQSPDNDTPEQSLVRSTVEHPQYLLDYSINSFSEELFISEAGMIFSKVMQSTNMVALDCEMVLCEDGTESVVRVGAVDRNLKVILDEFVKPHKPVVDYRTTITGVTAEDIKKATLSLVDIQEKLRPFLSTGTILVGHSLNHDLEVLKIDHPRVIDTSLVFKFPNATKLRRPSLNTLCMCKLGYEVQKTGVSHNCVHDAAAAMKLVLALLEKRVDTTITLTQEMIEADKSRLFLHRIPNSLPSAELNQVLSLKFFPKKFTVDVKPRKTQGRYYCALVIFGSSVDANQAFENLTGYQEKDSLGLPQKLISCVRATFYVRKMA